VKLVMSFYGTRGDVEPGLVVGRELMKRGHDVCMAVPPDLVGFAQSAGLEAFAYGLETQTWLDAYRNFWTGFLGKFWKIKELRRQWRELSEPITRCSEEISATLASRVEGADLLFTGLAFERAAADVAEKYDIPFATLHYVPVRANGQHLPFLPVRMGRAAMNLLDWVSWRMEKRVEDAERRQLHLSQASRPLSARLAERGSLEIQAYDEICFPGLAAEWAECGERRPFVGALTMESPTGADEEVISWITAGSPPIFFGFGSMPVESPAATLSMISAAAAELGERALVCSGWSNFSDLPHFDHVKVVGAVNFSAIFPMCRAVVHHGGAGTTAVGLRAGVPTLILSMDVNQTLWGSAVKRLKVGTTRKFSATTQKTLVADLQTILAADFAFRSRDLAPQMTRPAAAVSAAADRLESFVARRVG
jgi:UDP:flavonoid glycosyltransferase YjiC (YdhE family)